MPTSRQAASFDLDLIVGFLVNLKHLQSVGVLQLQLRPLMVAFASPPFDAQILTLNVVLIGGIFGARLVFGEGVIGEHGHLFMVPS